MEVFPLLCAGKDAGELTVEREGLYLRFSLRAALPEGVWCVWLTGDQGELSLGIPEPKGGMSCLCRRLSARSVESVGTILRGQVRPAGNGTEAWTCVPRPALLFRTPWLRQELAACEAALIRGEEERFLLALPCDARTPFPLVSLFCFARICRVCGQERAVFTFDEAERPLFWGGKE